jgi:NAD-dependent DNA ligase
MNDNYYKGECQQFCPAVEVQMRMKERLVHFYERNGMMVTEFKRSCPGQKILRAELRTEETLQKCVQYLLSE